MSSPLPADPSATCTPAAALRLRIVPAPDPEPPFDPDPFWARPRLRPVPDEPPAASTDGPPGAVLATRRMVDAYLDVLHGRRPAVQLLRLAVPEAVHRLRPAPAAPVRPRRRIRLQSLRVTEPVPGVAEAVAVLAEVDRRWAVALRMEYRRDSWRCTVLDPIEPARPAAVVRPTRRSGRRRVS